MRIALTILGFAVLATSTFAAPREVHWQFAFLDDETPLTVVCLVITDDNGERLVPLGSVIGPPQDLDVAEGPPKTILHGGAWWAGGGTYWAITPQGKSLRVWTRWADEGGPGGEGGGYGDWEQLTDLPVSFRLPPVVNRPETIAVERRLSVQKTRLHGPDVQLLQRLLYTQGYGDAKGSDGYYGPQTESWVKEFQTDRELEADGIVGPQTWRALLQQF